MNDGEESMYLGLIAKDVRVKADIMNEEVHMSLHKKKRKVRGIVLRIIKRDTIYLEKNTLLTSTVEILNKDLHIHT